MPNTRKVFADLKILTGKNRQMDRRIGIRSTSLIRGALIISAVGISGSVLSACGASASANAKQACGYVDQSISQFRLSTTQTNPALAASYQKKALTQLGSALPLAAIAAGSNGVYQALMATLSESSRVPEKLLVNALTRECAQVLPSNPNQQAPGGYVPPTNIKATS